MPRNLDLPLIGMVAAALVVALVVALVSTPVVKNLAIKVKAVDVPKDGRRMHDHPIPRMGGLAIFLGFLLSVLLFLELNPQMRGMLLGAVIIVVLGIFDDIYSLRAMFKFVVQIVAALVDHAHHAGALQHRAAVDAACQERLQQLLQTFRAVENKGQNLHTITFIIESRGPGGQGTG